MNKNVFISGILIISILLGILVFVFFLNTKDIAKKNTIIYYVQEFSSPTESFYTFYKYDIFQKNYSKITKLRNIHLYSRSSSVLVFNGGLMSLTQREIDGNVQLTRYTFASDSLETWDLDTLQPYGMIVSRDGSHVALKLIADINLETINPELGSTQWKTQVIDLSTGEQIELLAKDFEENQRTMQYIDPKGFFKNNELYVLTSPHTSFDRGSPMTMFRVNLTTMAKESILKIGFPIDIVEGEYNPELYKSLEPNIIFGVDLYPESHLALLERGMDLPRKIQSFSLVARIDPRP